MKHYTKKNNKNNKTKKKNRFISQKPVKKKTRIKKRKTKITKKRYQGGREKSANNNLNTAKLLRDEKRELKYQQQNAKANYRNDKVREAEAKIKQKQVNAKLKKITQSQKEEKKTKKLKEIEDKQIQEEKLKYDQELRHKELEKRQRKSLSSKKKIKLYIKNHIGPEQYKRRLHPLIGKFLVKPSGIRKKIRKSPFLARGKGIATITGNYEKYANEKLFCVILPEASNLKKLFYKKSLEKLKVIYMGDTVDQVNNAVSTPKPGMYIFIILKNNKKRIWIGNMIRESRDVSERLTKELMEESISQPNIGFQAPIVYPQQPGMYPPQPGMYPPQPGMYPQQPGVLSLQPTVASREKQILNTDIEV